MHLGGTAMTVKQRLCLVGGVTMLATTGALVILSSVRLSQFASDAKQVVAKQTWEDVAESTKSMTHLVQTQGDAIAQHVSSADQVLRDGLDKAGRVSLGSESVSWKASNQVNKEEKTVQLKKLLVGGSWLGQQTDPKVVVPVLDNVTKMTNCKTTIFQRMDAEGNMLRVATSVIGKTGKRAIGTFIPAVDAGKPNKVIETVLKGEVFRGTALVVDAWYVVEYAPIVANGQVIGMTFSGQKQESVPTLRKALEGAKVGVRGSFWVMGAKGTKEGLVFVSRDGAKDGKVLTEEKDANGNAYVKKIIEGALALKDDAYGSVEYTVKNDKGELETKVATYAYFQGWDWIVVADAYKNDYAAVENSLVKGRNQLLLLLLITGFFTAVAGAGLLWWMTTRMFKPMDELIATAHSVAQGDLSADISHHSSDEFGRLAQSYRDTMDYMREKADVAESISNGDLSIKVEARTSKDRLGIAFQKMMASLGQLIRAARDSAESVNAASTDLRSASGQSSRASNDLATAAQQSASATESLQQATNTVTTGSQQQVANIERASESALQATKAVEEVAAASNNMSIAASDTAQIAMQGGDAVTKTVKGMELIQKHVESSSSLVRELGDMGQKIGAIIQTIDEIAEQTNLLALNAAIEAARAGEHGRGFAVVAEEVRKLAERSSGATKEIATLIENVQKGVEQTVQAMVTTTEQVEVGAKQSEEAGKALDSILNAVNALASEVGGVSKIAAHLGQYVDSVVMSVDDVRKVTDVNVKAISEMAEGIGQLSDSVQMMAATSQETSAGAEEVEAMAIELNRMADELRQIVERFKVEQDVRLDKAA
jgi:methyl-accepting chemotaxis protein